MKLSKEEYQTKHVSLDDDDIGLPEEYPLTKVQAVRMIDKFHQEAILKKRVPDTAIDWRGIIEENLRHEAPDSSFKQDGSFVRRGNRMKWGAISCYRSARGNNCRVFFKEQDVIEWYYNNVEPVLAKAPTIH